MTSPRKLNNHMPDKQKNTLERESTLSLIRRIAEDSDTSALRVFHETRTLFYRNGKWVRLADFIRALKDGNIREAGEEAPSHRLMSETSEDAYDLTLAKFFNMPASARGKTGEGEGTADSQGFTWNVDCRLYYQFLLQKIQEELATQPASSEWEVEESVARITTQFVLRHYRFSMKECQRRERNAVRYTWNVQGRKLYLFYPYHLTAKQFREWLEENTTDVDLNAPDAEERIKEKVKLELSDGDLLDPASEGHLLRAMAGQYQPEPVGEQDFPDRLSIYVAREKSEHLEQLRPSIRSLGKDRVYNRVLRIFSDIQEGEYALSEVAREYGLSKASLSRFAGPDWRRETGKEQAEDDIPDLWINTARVLARHRTLWEAVMNSGFAVILQEILDIIGPERGHTHG